MSFLRSYRGEKTEYTQKTYLSNLETTIWHVNSSDQPWACCGERTGINLWGSRVPSHMGLLKLCCIWSFWFVCFPNCILVCLFWSNDPCCTHIDLCIVWMSDFAGNLWLNWYRKSSLELGIQQWKAGSAPPTELTGEDRWLRSHHYATGLWWWHTHACTHMDTHENTITATKICYL